MVQMLVDEVDEVRSVVAQQGEVERDGGVAAQTGGDDERGTNKCTFA
ncbi:hypothetical protein LUX33_09840 [Actinomadura madurae]|nr:hypothetical protein [Actinomadura madurae]MCP9948684.1 hypothetical protein [Actinomadura madurae]MCP9965457.1 hypothetical protein [Actinomadura madurae]